MDNLIRIFSVNSKNASRDRMMLMRKYAFITELVLKGGFLTYTLAAAFYPIYPIYAYYWNNELIPMIPLFFPFIDEDTKSGFITITSIHFIFVILALISSACTDFMFAMIIVNIPVLSNIFFDNVRELNEILRKEKVDMVLAKAKFKNILLLHREYCE